MESDIRSTENLRPPISDRVKAWVGTAARAVALFVEVSAYSAPLGASLYGASQILRIEENFSYKMFTIESILLTIAVVCLSNIVSAVKEYRVDTCMLRKEQ